MHPDVHLRLHHLRSEELRGDADARRAIAPHRLRQPPVHLRTRIGWTLVELGLRLATGPGARGEIHEVRPA
ncbi:hypothetical protein GBW32_13255 [Streptomyces tsukubensis]|uniref:Uncharacterized protein n=1 Tax=Streptomyces tsukubensis TaxID=83656 RepID=A0A1V4A1A3_9ACTN|nr:hypothetical protein B1H18_29145 [Streptomyces tsukubensis]QFR93860.1 hypothetical protein GBW32_13255 [Streptomyces tsukubensis]